VEAARPVRRAGRRNPPAEKAGRALRSDPYTYVPTRSGMAYVCFIVDAFSRWILGWRVAANMRTDMVLDALEMARRSRGGRRLVGLVAHSDAESQFTSVRFTERLAEIGARPSIGTVADSYDNALAETTNGLYKAECVFGPDAAGFDNVSHWFTLASLETPDRGFLPRRWCGLLPRRPARSRGLRSPREGLRESPVSGFLHHVNDDMVTASR